MASTIANSVPNTIVVSEKRDVVNNFRNWYKEKIIDTGLSQKFEEGLVEYHKLQEKMLVAFGHVATVVLALCPVDGPYGEAITIAAKPFIPRLIRLQNEANERNILTAKRSFEANFIKADGSSEKVSIPEIQLDNFVKEAKQLIDQVADLDNGSSKGVSR